MDIEGNENAIENQKELEGLKFCSDSLRALKNVRKEKNDCYRDQMQSLWGLDYTDIKNVRTSCSRQTMGYVNFGGQSLRFGSKGIGLGYVSLCGFCQYLDHYITKYSDQPSLKNITKNRGILVLLRSPDAVHYSFGLLKVCV